MADQQPGSSPSAVAEEGSEELPGADRVTRMLAAELGPQMAGAFARSREVQERIARERHPSEGLRERKKRLTRQQISDAATTLFIVRGFEHVTVAQIAEVVGVSEKTVYNYFPTKESLVFDRAEEGTERLASMMREREPGESPTRVMLTAIEHELSELEELPDETHMLLPLFAEMVSCTPALRAAWLELQDRLTDLVTNELARHADIDPREPEPRIAASALLGLQAVAFSSRIRHVEDGLRGRALSEAIANDLRRAARLLDTGLWSFSLLTYGVRTLSQWREASLATEESREQVVAALKRARSSWQELRGQAREQTRTQRNEIKREAKAKQAAARKQARQAVRASEAAARERTKRKVAEVRGRPGAGQSSRDGAERARAAYGAFRAAMAERHEAIRGRSPSPSLTGDDAGAPDD